MRLEWNVHFGGFQVRNAPVSKKEKTSLASFARRNECQRAKTWDSPLRTKFFLCTARQADNRWACPSAACTSRITRGTRTRVVTRVISLPRRRATRAHGQRRTPSEALGTATTETTAPRRATRTSTGRKTSSRMSDRGRATIQLSRGKRPQQPEISAPRRARAGTTSSGLRPRTERSRHSGPASPRSRRPSPTRRKRTHARPSPSQISARRSTDSRAPALAGRRPRTQKWSSTSRGSTTGSTPSMAAWTLSSAGSRSWNAGRSGSETPTIYETEVRNCRIVAEFKNNFQNRKTLDKVPKHAYHYFRRSDENSALTRRAPLPNVHGRVAKQEIRPRNGLLRRDLQLQAPH